MSKPPRSDPRERERASERERERERKKESEQERERAAESGRERPRTTREPLPCEEKTARRENSFKGRVDFYLKAKAII